MSSNIFLCIHMEWKGDEINVCLREDMEGEFNKHKTLWNHIAQILKEKGCNATAEQSSNKWNNF